MIDETPSTYLLGTDQMEFPWIKCLLCGMTSYNSRDIEKRYCGNCHRFHEPRVTVRVSQPTDEDLVREQEITRVVPLEDGCFDVTLSCGHTVCWVVKPLVTKSVCATCVNVLVERRRPKKP
jgi:hypothetical protein